MTKPTPTKVALSAVAKLKDRLGDVPTHQADEVSKQRAIGLLVPQLLAMHAKGYTWRAIASLLTDEGLAVTPTALQGYVRRAHSQDMLATTRGRKGRRAPASTVPLSPSPTSATEKAPTAPNTPTMSEPSREAARPPAGAPSGPPAPGDSGVRRTSPSPRRDPDAT
jgi:hypothetical protein